MCENDSKIIRVNYQQSSIGKSTSLSLLDRENLQRNKERNHFYRIDMYKILETFIILLIYHNTQFYR